ncbi:hypothetical protein CRENPOLYSF1_1530007 [Crenothrix polyspora]|uniref:Uncharacterized protein n=1 Tax=Crenothrix polyspora TaxID=360316 RepID=A0A1R4H393_9GAMM|nr:hypothetical protein CRENPOLYSF1_1530007 [Crenothrix polyspora]
MAAAEVVVAVTDGNNAVIDRFNKTFIAGDVGE